MFNPIQFYHDKCTCVFPKEKARKAFNLTHMSAHCVYFYAVMQEGHGLYAMVGGSLLFFTIISLTLAFIGADNGTD